MGVVHTKVAAVLMFVDAVAERRVRYRGLQIRTDPPGKVIWKDMDCAVILAQQNIRKMDIVIWGKFYQEVDMQIALNSDNAPQVYTIWLPPSEYYPFQENMTIIQGQCSHKELYLLWQADSTKYKLMETTAVGSDCISLWGIHGSIEGRMFMLCEDKMELVTLVGQIAHRKHVYRTKTGMQKVFHKGRTKLYKAVKVQTDSNGKFLTGFQKEMPGDDNVLFWSGGETVDVSLFY